MIFFVQPFGLGTHSGGSRILRALLKNAPMPWTSIAATPQFVPKPPFGEEIHVKGRPYFYRLERGRFARLPLYLDGIASRRAAPRILQLANQKGAKGIHAIAHTCWDTIAAYEASRQLKVPFFLSVHDDPVYCLGDHPLRDSLLEATAECWRNAAARFVISDEMGQELCRRWGSRKFLLVTDGSTAITEAPRTSVPRRLAVYFMGMFHLCYEANLQALQHGLNALKHEMTDLDISLTLRCGHVRSEAIVSPEYTRVLPFADERVVANEITKADLLYMPLSFDPDTVAMAAFSLSTKMVTYLGSGIPILYHGPANAAAGALLARSKAAFCCNSTNPAQVSAAILESLSGRRNEIINNAIRLSKNQFDLENIRSRFWDSIANNI